MAAAPELRAPSVPAPVAVGTNFVHGNELTMMEKRMAPLQFSEPYFLQKSLTDKRVLKEPLRFSEHMTEIRGEEVTGYGKRRLKDTRKMKVEFTDKIKDVINRQKREEEEARKTNKDKRARWWHRTRGPDQRDPLKYLRYTNLKMVPESLLMSKDVVILQLTGARLGDAAMSWIGAFLQQSYTVKRVILQGNYITEEGVEHITLGLRSSRSLMELDISLNPIGDLGVELLSNALLENNKFSRLYLLNVSCCELTAASGFHLGRLLHEFKHIECLLAWRNRLGIADGAPISGAGILLDELRHAPQMKMVNLTANNITDREASEHAAVLERGTRRVTVGILDKANRKRRAEQFRAEAAERKGRMVGRNMDEKMAIHRLERQADQEDQKLEMLLKLEERQRSYAERQERDFLVRVKNQTGLEIETKKTPCRLILTANQCSQSTMTRLSRYYSVAADPDVDKFLVQTRRYDNLVIPRRSVGMEYTELRDPDSFDPHNVLPWDMGSTPQGDFDRRQALLQWREEERIRDEELVIADFNKFAMHDIAHLPPEERVRASSGFNLASGVNARVRVVRDAAKAAVRKVEAEKEEHDRITRIRSQYGLKADATPVVPRTPTYQPKRVKDEAMIKMASQVGSGAGGGDSAQGQATGPEGGVAIVIDPTMIATTSEVMDDVGPNGIDQGFVEVTESDLMKHKMKERMDEVRLHIEQKQQAHGQADDAQPMLSPRVAAGPLQDILQSMEAVKSSWSSIQTMGEIGSPSDEDLKRLEEARGRLVEQKRHTTDLILSLCPVGDCPFAVEESSDVELGFAQFLEDLVKETDTHAGNTDLVGAIVDRIPMDVPRILAERGLVAMSASDGSDTYFSKFLSVPNQQFDVSEVCAACFYNQTSRVPLTLMLLQFMDLAPHAEEVGDMLREFFADVASDRRAIPRENRVLKMTLLRAMLNMPWLALNVQQCGADGQSIFTRALYEGDIDVVDMLIDTPGAIRDINHTLPDGTTALMQAVMGNSLAVVQRLFAQFQDVDVSIRSDNGNALDLAVGLSRNVKIVGLLREKGAQPSGVKVDKEAAAPKKIVMKSPTPRGSSSSGSGDRGASPSTQ